MKHDLNSFGYELDDEVTPRMMADGPSNDEVREVIEIVRRKVGDTLRIARLAHGMKEHGLRD